VTHVTGINFSTLAADWSNFPALLKAGLPAGLVYSAPGNGVTVLTTTATGPSATISAATPPTDGSTDITGLLNLTQADGAVATQGSAGSGSADARTMLANGDYTLWTSGPVAQTIILGDNSPTRKYDIGFGDGFHPFRPHFEATFWPATHQVYVRAIGENDLSTELEDLSYSLTLTGANAKVYSNAGLTQGALATWTQEFWLGGTPRAQVNIDNNLAYLESTRFVPNYDPALTVDPTALADDYAAWWTNASPTAIGGDTGWTPGMPTTGARADIGPNPTWIALWLHTGDWRMRQVSLASADRAAWWQVNTRETDTTERLNTSDPVPVAPAVGTGYGHPVSITDRVQLGDSGQNIGGFIYNNSGDPNPPNTLKVVGPLNTSNPNGWTFDVAHMPQPFFVPYILTGDPFYLGEMENWAAYVAATEQGQYASATNQGRGPTGAEGGLYYSLRGDGWGLLQRAEAAFAEPDGTPEKTYLTNLTNSDIARWDGALGITGDAFAGTAEYVWAQQTGDPESRNTPNHAAPPLGNWEDGGPNPNFDGGGMWLTSLDNIGYTNQWMQWYVQYAIGRIHELGFADGPLALHSGAYLTNEINISGYPELIAAYIMPTNFVGPGQIATWPDLIADLTPAYLTGTNWAASCGSDCTSQGPLPSYFARGLYSQGYQAYAQAALAPLVDQGAVGAAQAWSWVKANVHDPLMALTMPGGPAYESDPSWDIVPRTDTNALPAQPTTQP